MASDWNLFLERVLAADLSKAGYKLALALARLLLGYRRRQRRLGRDLLMQTSGITDRRTFERAMNELTREGVIEYEAGRKGRGGRGDYRLLLPTTENAASTARPFTGTEIAAPDRHLEDAGKCRSRAAS